MSKDNSDKILTCRHSPSDVHGSTPSALPTKSRPPPAMSRQQLTINDLPSEVLIHVAAQFTGRGRNADLMQLALVSKLWAPIAQEWLLREPRFNMIRMHWYMWQLSQKPWLMALVRRLDIWSTKTGRVRKDKEDRASLYRPMSAPKVKSNVDPIKLCVYIASCFVGTKVDKEKWVEALKDDIVPALFGVLLCGLPMLRELRLGESWLIDIPFFGTLFSTELRTKIRNPRASWKNCFLAEALEAVLPRLQLLEVPADMTAMVFPPRTSIFDFRRFEQLREVGITMKALPFWPPFTEGRTIFPPSLEVLKISEAHEHTDKFLKGLCCAKEKGHFPVLRRIEVYYWHYHTHTEKAASRFNSVGHVETMRVLCKDAKLELYLYFPAWEMVTWEAGGTPWSLKEHGDALLLGEKKCEMQYAASLDPPRTNTPTSQRFEAEWDSDGDVVMSQ